VVRGLPVPHQGVLCDLPGVLPSLCVDGLPGVGGAVDPRALPPHRAVLQPGHASLQTRMVAPGDSSGREYPFAALMRTTCASSRLAPTSVSASRVDRMSLSRSGLVVGSAGAESRTRPALRPVP